MDAQQHHPHKLDTDISFLQNARLLVPRSHSDRVLLVQTLAMARFERYVMLEGLDDLNQSILNFTEAIFLPIIPCPNIIHILFFVTHALVIRACRSRQPGDVTHSIIYLRHLRGQSLEPFNIPPIRVTELLVVALGIQVEMGLGDERKDIEEMADLCHELLNSNIPTNSETDFIVAFIRAVSVQFRSELQEPEQEPSDKVIECLREANIGLPDSHGISIALARSLYNRFRLACSNDDYEEGITILDKVIHSPGDRQTHHQNIARVLVCSFAGARSEMSGKPEYLEEAIYRIRTLLDTLSPEDPRHAIFAFGLAVCQASRFDDSGPVKTCAESGRT